MALVLGFATCGCKPQEPRGRIAGKVTFQGQAVSDAMIVFSQGARGVNMTAKLEPDGGYEVRTARGAGLPLGEYRICVCLLPPDVDMGRPRADAVTRPRPDIPAKYRSFETSGLTLTVKNGNNPFDIEMKP